MANSTPSNPVFDYRNSSYYTKGALYVIPFGFKKSANVFSGAIPFALNPESISESLTGGWIHKAVPGQSDPVSSWVGNGVRTVSLALLITNDTSSANGSQFASQTSKAN